MQRFPYLWQLFEGAWWKAIVIAAYSWLAAVQRLANVNYELGILVLLLLLFDWYSGRLAAVRRGERLTSWGRRRTISKVNQYAVFIFTTTIISHGLGAHYSVFEHLEIWGYIFVALTEGKSITENLFGRRTSRDIWQRLTRTKLFGEDAQKALDQEEQEEKGKSDAND